MSLGVALVALLRDGLAVGVVRSSAGVSNKDLRSRENLELVLFLSSDYSDKEIGSGAGRRKCDTV